MDFKKLGIIIQREYLNKVKKKSFLLTTFGVPILFAGMYAVMIFIMLRTEVDTKRIAVIDNSGIVMPTSVRSMMKIITAYMPANRIGTPKVVSRKDF